MIPRALLLLSLTLPTAGSRELRAQAATTGQPTRVPATVVMVDELPATDGPFHIERRMSEPRDVIVLRADATKDQLSDAIRTLLVVRQIAGDTAAQPARMRMRPHQANPGTHREFPWAQRVLADLRRAARRDVAGLGHVRAVVIWLPPQHRRPSR